MKILIVSDTHGINSNLREVIKKVKSIDLLIHLGDFESETDSIESLVRCPVEMVCGNNDFSCDLEYEKIINIKNYKILLTHGHRHGVHYDLKKLRDVAKIYNADIVMYGHTHRPQIEEIGGIWAVNPGSISLPRQENRKPSYIIMDIDHSGTAHFTLNYLNKPRKRWL